MKPSIGGCGNKLNGNFWQEDLTQERKAKENSEYR